MQIFINIFISWMTSNNNNSCLSKMMWTCILDLSPCLRCLRHCGSSLLEGVEGKGNSSSQKISYCSGLQAKFPQLLPCNSENHSSSLVCQTSLNITTVCMPYDKHAGSQKYSLLTGAVWQYFRYLLGHNWLKNKYWYWFKSNN